VILVAEDNEVNQLVAIRLLEKRGFSVDVAANGRIAVEMHEHGSYDAILMDCQMPELDGYAATAEIRRREGRGRHIPIIAMTAHAMKGDRERCLRAGMDDYVRKPVGAAVLDDVLARAVWCAASPPEEPGDVDRLDDSDGSLPAVFDPRLLAEISDGDEAIRQQLVAMFLEQARTDVPRLAIALARGDAGKAREVAHALKGSAAAVGADRLADAAARLCADAEAGRLDDAVRDQSALEQACALTEAALIGIVAVGSA
jgi:CheY-like chemotaxis protein